MRKRDAALEQAQAAVTAAQGKAEQAASEATSSSRPSRLCAPMLRT